MNTTLSPQNSLKFRFWSFVSMVLLVFVHGYNLDVRYLQPWTIPGEPMTVTAFLEYWFANGLLRFRIPMLFAISGYLFAMHDHMPHGVRMRKRLRTLLAPYLLWSAAGFLLVAMMEWTDLGRDILRSTRMLQIDEQRMFLSEYRWDEILGRWVFGPIPYQLWFLRSLLMCNLLYPGLRWCISRRIASRMLFGFAVLLWMAGINILFIEGEGLLFFSLGIWMQRTGFDIDTPGRWLHPAVWGTLFITVSAMKTFLAFSGELMLGEATGPVLLLLHKVTVGSGLIAAWYTSTGIAQRTMERRWFAWLSGFSFIIYAMHAPFIAFAIDGVFRFVHPLPMYRLATFVLLPLAVIAMCVGTGWVLRRMVPRVYGVLTGGRGL